MIIALKIVTDYKHEDDVVILAGIEYNDFFLSIKRSD